MSREEQQRLKAALHESLSSEEVEDDEEEEEDEEEDEEDDEDDNITEPGRNWDRPPMMPLSDEERLQIKHLKDIFKNFSEERLSRELRKCEGDMERTVAGLLDSNANEAVAKDPYPERERKQLFRRLEEVSRAGGEAGDALCNTVRSRLLWGDSRLPWLDGALVVAICERSLKNHKLDFSSLSRPQQAFLNECLGKSTSIMLDQELAPDAENFFFASTLVDSALEIAIAVFLQSRNVRFVEVIALALNPTKNLWKGSTGSDEYNKRLNRVSHETRLMPSLIETLRGPWLGADVVAHILAIFRFLDAAPRVVPLVREKLSTITAAEQSLKTDRAFEGIFREMMLTTNDDSTDIEDVEEDVTSAEFVARRKEIQKQRRHGFQRFWFTEVALRLFLTTNLEQRLFGLSQIERLIDACAPYQSVLSTNEFPMSRVSSFNGPNFPYSPLGLKKPGFQDDKESFSDLEESVLVEWLAESKFFDLLTDENKVHSEILARSRKIVRFMVGRSNELPASFSEICFRQLWVLGVSQHESIRQVVLDLLIDAFEESPPCRLQGAEFLRFLAGLPDSERPFVADFLASFKRKLGFAPLVASPERANVCFMLAWELVQKVDESLLEKCYGLYTELVSTDSGRRKRVFLLEQCLSDIRARCESNQDSLRSLNLFRKLLDFDTIEMLLQLPGDASENSEQPASGETIPKYDEQGLLQLLLKDLQKHRTKEDSLQFRLDTLVSIIRQMATRKNSQFTMGFDLVRQVMGTLQGQTEASSQMRVDEHAFFFLDRLLKTSTLSLAVVCETFERAVCPGWRKLCGVNLAEQTQTDETLATRALVAWGCFKDYFEELRRPRTMESSDTEDALRVGRECIWEAALSPNTHPAIADSAMKLAIDETDKLEDELPKILSKLRATERSIRSNPNDAAALWTASRCLGILCRFAESEKDVQWETEPIPHGIGFYGGVTKLVLQINSNGSIIAHEPGSPSQNAQTVSDVASQNTCVRDVVLHLRQDLGVPSVSLFIGNVDVTNRWWTPMSTFVNANHTVQGVVVPHRKRHSMQLDNETRGEDDVDSPKSARMIMARSDALFDLLHELQSLGESLGAVKHDVLQLLNSLPPRRSLVAMLNAENNDMMWNSLLTSSNHAANAYRVEVIASMLHPSIMRLAEQSKAFRARFVAAGGLKAVLDFFNKSLPERVHPSEVAYDGNGFLAALRVMTICYKEISQKDEEWSQCILTMRNIFQATHEHNGHVYDLIRSWSPEAIVSLLSTTAHAVVSLLSTRESSVDCEVVEQVIQEMVRIVRFSENVGLREYIAKTLETIARHTVYSDIAWDVVRTGCARHNHPESFKAIWMVWHSKRPTPTENEEAAALLNQIITFIKQSFEEKTGCINPEHPFANWLASVFEMLYRMLPEVHYYRAPSPPTSTPPTAHSQHVIVKRFVSVTLLDSPEDFLSWLAETIVLSLDISRNNKQLFYIGSLLVTQLCTAEPGSTDNFLCVVKCRQRLCECIKAKMQTTTRLNDWSFNPEQVLRSNETSYVGLINQGATCYMNSLLQQFFLSPTLRSWITHDPSDQKQNRMLEGVEPEMQMQARDVLKQVRRVFKYLRGSTRRYVDTKDLVESCKSLKLSNPVYQQNDARDLCDKLVDRIEIAMKTMGFENPTRTCFGGRVIHQNIKQGCPHPPTERADDFIALELQIKGKHTLENSLRDFCAGELLDGENKVQCDECNQKYPALLRDCLADTLPKVLVLHLKRFQLDYDTFETVKVNDRLSFPMQLDVSPFTREGLLRVERGDPLTPQLYNLCGVIVHRGVAGGGHYFSFAKDRVTDKWYRFNDDRVSPFDVKHLEQECFGGRNDMQSGSDGEANAYMLFYEKCEEDEKMDVVEGEVDGTLISQNSNMSIESVEKEVEGDNVTLGAQLLLCSSEIGNAMISLLEQPLVATFFASKEIATEDEVAHRLALQTDQVVADVNMDLCLDWAVRTANTELYERWTKALGSHAEIDERGWLCDSLTKRVTCRLNEVVTKCRNPGMRRPFLLLGSTAAAAPMVSTESLACYLATILELAPETSKSFRHMSDLLYSLYKLLETSHDAKALMRDETTKTIPRGILRHGLAKLVHLALGDADCFFVDHGARGSGVANDPEIQAVDDPVTVLLVDSPDLNSPGPSVVTTTTTTQPGQIDALSGPETDDEEKDDVMQMTVGPKLKPLGWTWNDRLMRWNSSAALSLVQSTAGSTSVNGSNMVVFENLYDCIGLLICPVQGLPPYLRPLFEQPMGIFYQRAVREGFSQTSVRDWLVELCSADPVECADNKDRKSSASYRIIMDLLAFITRPSMGNPSLDSEVESARYESCVSVLEAILSIDDGWQIWRIHTALKTGRISGSPRAPTLPLPNSSSTGGGSNSQVGSNYLRRINTEPTPEIKNSDAAIASALSLAQSSTLVVPDGLLTCCASAMRKYWGQAALLNQPSAFQSPGSSPYMGGGDDRGGVLWRLPIADALHCERHIKTLGKLVMEAPPFGEVLKRLVDQQKKELAAGEDDLTRLVYWYAGKSFEQSYGGELSEHRRTKRRGSDPDQILQALAPIVGIPQQYIAGRLWKLTEPVAADDANRYVLGPYHLFDDKVQYAAAWAYVIDYPVKKPGVVVEFCARMGSKFVKDAPAASSDDPYVCIVVGKRPGDTQVRMREEAMASGNPLLKVFDRVVVRSSDVYRKRAEMVHQSSKSRKERSQQAHASLTTEENGNAPKASEQPSPGTPSKKLKMEIPNPPPVTATTTTATPATTSTTPTTVATTTGTQQPTAAVRSNPKSQSKSYVDSFHGVVVKIYTLPGSKKRIIVVRLDSVELMSESSHSQLIELDEVPDDDPLVLEFPEDAVYQSDEPLSLLDHQYTIVRTAPIPAFNYRDSKVVHSRQLEVAVFPGERLGVARHSQLGFAWSQWLDFDRQVFSYYYANKAILAKEGSVVGPHFTFEANARPAFHFKVATLDGHHERV